MADGKPSALVLLLLVALHLIAFGFAVAAERRRSTAKLVPDTTQTGTTYCVYSSDVATGYGVGAFLFVFLGFALSMVTTRCLCCGSAMTPGGPRAWAIIYFLSSWVAFLVAEACFLAGAVRNAYHTKYRTYIYDPSCETLRKGVFAAGAAFTVFTLVLSSLCYINYCRTRDGVRKPPFRGQPNAAGKSNIGMASYA